MFVTCIIHDRCPCIVIYMANVELTASKGICRKDLVKSMVPIACLDIQLISKILYCFALFHAFAFNAFNQISPS